MTPLLTVVIPYYQSSRGILRKALASVGAQQGCPLPLRVLVVDDASPVPAVEELKTFSLPAGMHLEVVQRPNGGPGAARNTGLDAAYGTRYVAFLDSDDEWSPDHLKRAVLALEQGYDFYFANLFQLDQSVGAFERAGRICPSEHPSLPGTEEGLHAYAGDMFDQINTGNVIGTPTVVYRYEKFSLQRFMPEFRAAGEDYCFWIALTTAGARICFSSKVEATCGRGVNVYAGVEWGTHGHLQRVHDEGKYKHYIATHFKLTPAQSASINNHRKRLRHDFASSLLSLFSHRRKAPWRLLARHFVDDPQSFLMLPWVALRKSLAAKRS